MKLSDTKHNHSLTTILKVCLFGLVMILPFLAILPSTLYFAFNEHAQNYTHEEVITTYEYETNEVNSVDDLVVGNIYKAQIDLNTLTANTGLVRTKNLFNIVNDNNTSVARYTSQELFNFHFDAPNLRYIIYISGQYEVLMYNVNKEVKTFYFVFETTNSLYNGLNISASDYLGEKNVEVESSEQSPLNAFNTASNNVWNSPIFNWVNDGLGSIAIANMLVVFGIAQNTFISNILIYWLSITAIYIIIDIVISAFTILTHLITKKAE